VPCWHLSELEGAAGGPESIQPSLDVNLAAMEALSGTTSAATTRSSRLDVVSAALSG